jgi:cell division protein FtsL
MVNVRLRRRGPLFVWVLAAVAGGLLGAAAVVWARTEITGSRYRLTSLLDRRAALEAEVEKLRIEAAALSAPERVEPRARKLGLRYPEAGQVVPLEDPRGIITDVAAPPPEAAHGGKHGGKAR